MAGPAGAFEDVGELRHLHERRLQSARVHRLDAGSENDGRAGLLAQFQVVVERSRITVEIFVGPELGGIDEDRDDGQVGLAAAPLDQPGVAGVEGAHRGNKPDALARLRVRRIPRLRTAVVVSRSSTTRLAPRLPAAVRAIGIVQALSGISRSLTISPSQDRVRHDPRHVGNRDAAVPDAHADRSRRSARARTGRGSRRGWRVPAVPDPAAFSSFLNASRSACVAIGVAAAPLVARFTDISAYEDMMGEGWHWERNSGCRIHRAL